MKSLLNLILQRSQRPEPQPFVSESQRKAMLARRKARLSRLLGAE